MTKTYSVPKNRYLAVLLVNTPYPLEPREETPRQRIERRRDAISYIAVASAFAEQFYEGRGR